MLDLNEFAARTDQPAMSIEICGDVVYTFALQNTVEPLEPLGQP